MILRVTALEILLFFVSLFNYLFFFIDVGACLRYVIKRTTLFLVIYFKN